MAAMIAGGGGIGQRLLVISPAARQATHPSIRNAVTESQQPHLDMDVMTFRGHFGRVLVPPIATTRYVVTVVEPTEDTLRGAE